MYMLLSCLFMKWNMFKPKKGDYMVTAPKLTKSGPTTFEMLQLQCASIKCHTYIFLAFRPCIFVNFARISDNTCTQWNYRVKVDSYLTRCSILWTLGNKAIYLRNIANPIPYLGLWFKLCWISYIHSQRIKMKSLWHYACSSWYLSVLRSTVRLHK